MKKNKKYPKYSGGGKFWDGLGNVAANTGLALGDTALSALGATNVIKDDMYKGKSAQGFATTGNILGGIAKAAAPMALNALAPGSGMALSAVQSGVGQATADPNQVPQQGYSQGYAPQAPNAGFNPMSMIGPMMNMGMQMAPYGGQINQPNAEVEKQENTLNPDGSTNQYNGPSHSQGGVKAQLDPGTLVFSDRLKMGKKTFADLNKINNTSKEDAILASKAKGTSKLTAELMKMAKNKNSIALFEKQEELKAKKMGNYAKRIGMEMPYGGKVPQYWNGGPIGPETQDQSYGNQGIMQLGYQPGLYQQTVANHYGAPVHPMGPGASNMPYQAPGVVPQQNLANQGNSINTNTNPNVSNYDPSMSFSPNNTSGMPTESFVGGNGANWGNIGTQAALGVAQNAGNLYDLYRSRKPEVTNFDRVNANLLDPTQAISDNNMTFKSAVNSARDSSVGNSSTFLNNRRALASEKMRANARIRSEYDNMNTGIKNNTAAMNTNISMQENIANSQNRARNEDIRANAIASIGKNSVGQYADYNKQKTAETYEQDLLGAIEAQYPGAQKNPALLSYYKKYGKTGK